MVIETTLILLIAVLVLLVTIIGTYWLFVAFASMRTQLRDTQHEQSALRAELNRVGASLAAAQERIRQLERVFREVTGQEPPPEPAGMETGRRRPSWAQLAQRIAERFSMEEINELAFELELDQVLSGETQEGRASSLVKVAAQREKLGELVALCRERRPKGQF